MTMLAVSLSVLFATLVNVAAQSDQVALCTNSNLQWSFNSLNQSPCVVASFLGGACNSGVFTVPSLEDGKVYLGPTALNANPCRCSSVFYSLIAACSLCQTRDYLRWSTYNTNCTSVYSTVFPRSIPSGTRVPHWAYLDVTIKDEFDVEAAQANNSGPESTGVAQPTVSRTSTGTDGLPASTSTSSESKKSNAGAIAGGVIGGVVVLALVGGGLFWLVQHRRKKASIAMQHFVAPIGSSTTSPPPIGYADSPMPLMSNYTGTGTPSMKPYDPSDPSTYPTSPASYPATVPPPIVYPAPEVQQPYTMASQPGLAYPDSNQGRHYTGVPEL